jgi:hypothetical protein
MDGFDWTGCTVVCIASGPSLSADDCERVERSGLPTIAVNTSWKMARFAQVLYAGDACWWNANIAEVDIAAQRWTCSGNAATKHEINFHSMCGAYNSGLRAIQLAMDFGAKKILLLGYDCSVKHGTHWHGEHKKTKNPTAAKCHMWQAQFARIKNKKCEIINCSRVTALSCFTKKPLEEVLL